MNDMVRKLFNVKPKFEMFDEEGRALIELGMQDVRSYFVEKATFKKQNSLVDMLGADKVEARNSLDEKVVSKLVKYSLKKAGVDVSDFDINMIANPMLHKKQIFRETFNAVIAQIMTPVVPAMISAEFMDLADIANIGFGDTARFPVHSNDTFYVTRQAEGVLQGSVQRLFNNELTVDAVPYNIKTTVDWYQVAAGLFDLGEFIYKVGYSFNAYITQTIIQAIGQNIAASAGSAYFVNGFSTQNWTKLSELLRPANGGAKVRAYGTMTALSAIHPEGATASGVGNMQFQLGEEWSKVGYISTYKDVDLIRIPQILLPNTVNTTPLGGVPDNIIYMFADGGYKPVKLVFEGKTMSVDVVPTESPDQEMGVNVTMRFGHTFLAASKYGAITGVNNL